MTNLFEQLRPRFSHIPSIGLVTDFFADWTSPSIPRDDFIKLATKLDRFEAIKIYKRLEVNNIRTLLPEQIDLTYQIFGESQLFNVTIYVVGDSEFLIGFQGEYANEIGSFLIQKNKEIKLKELKDSIEQRIKSLQDEGRKRKLINAEIAKIQHLVERGKKSEKSFEYGIYAGYNAEERMDSFEFMEPFTYESYTQTLNGAAYFNYVQFLVKCCSLNDEIKSSLAMIFKKPEYYKKCLEILEQYEVSDLPRKSAASTVFGIADAIKEKSVLFLITTRQGFWTDEMLLDAFNKHLNTNYGGKGHQIKREGATFTKVKSEVKTLLSNL